MANSLHASTVSWPLHISGITVDFSKSKTNEESVEVRIGKSHSSIEREARKNFRQTFSPHMELSRGDTFSLHMRYKKWLGMKTENEDIIFNPEEMFRVYSANEKQEYTKVHNKIRIVVDFSGDSTAEAVSPGDSLELRPTTSEIFRKCPRFRILVIGKTGVGKSSLINHIFGVEKTIASHDKPGDANIDHEFISPQNDKFVLHDSKGFEPGEVDNLKIVRDFIDRRRNMSAPEHQLHAVWLCFEIPRAGGRFLETGTEEFLTLKSSGTLGNTHKDYRETLTRLIQITENCVGQHSAPEAAVMTSIAQRVHPGLKIKASIEVGKKKYWKALASSPTFNNRKTWDCLYVLHTDIVRVWNFYDPHHYLHSQEFREMMVKMVDKLEVGPTANPTKTITIGLSMVGTIAGIVSALAGPAAPIVVPIAVGAVLAVWVHDVYQISHAVLQRFMSYIVHLTLVLQTLYLLSESQELTRRAIKLAVASYLESPMSGEVHTWIQEYDTQLNVLERADRDTLDKIVEVMQLYSINAEEISILQAKIPPVGSSLDEPWETEKS
ncbi:hypothetical protein EDD22DRAFT_823989 [Suillus occidentalis]|nr:hypothetical protein EDD22DRAFT_823989 [Suillus occidentalis]